MAGVRGYADWNPKPEARYWVRCTREVLDEFQDDWPLSVRQIFYRLVAAYEYTKTEEAYMRLTQMLSRARRAGMLPWSAIRDGGQGFSGGVYYNESEDEFLKEIRESADGFMLNRQRDQEHVIELWCEAGGMVPILQRVAAPYSAKVNSGGGYDSVTGKHRLATRVRERAAEGLKTLILHVGDFDGSGEDMCDVLRDDTLHMVGAQVLGRVRDEDDGIELPDGIDLYEDEEGTVYTREAVRWALDFFDVQRVALTGQQVVDRQVITAPPKKSDSRTKQFIANNRWVVEELGSTDISAQLEALSPPELRALLQETIEGHLDMAVYQEVLREEQTIRESLMRRLETVGDE